MHINASFSTISMYDYAITFKASTVCSTAIRVTVFK